MITWFYVQILVLSSLIPICCIVRVYSSFISSEKRFCIIFITSRNAIVTSVNFFLYFQLIQVTMFQHFVYKVVYKIVCDIALIPHLLLQHFVEKLGTQGNWLVAHLCSVFHIKVPIWKWKVGLEGLYHIEMSIRFSCPDGRFVNPI